MIGHPLLFFSERKNSEMDVKIPYIKRKGPFWAHIGPWMPNNILILARDYFWVSLFNKSHIKIRRNPQDLVEQVNAVTPFSM